MENNMEHPKCKTCSHFSAKSGSWDTPETFGLCRLIEMTCEMTEWDENCVNLTMKPEFEGHLAGVMDGSSYSAALYPDPEFYCPMHSDLMPQLVED